VGVRTLTLNTHTYQPKSIVTETPKSVQRNSTKLATNFKLVRLQKSKQKEGEKYECKKSCSRPHIHTHTPAHSHTHTHTCMQMVLLPLCFFFGGYGMRLSVLVLLWSHAV